MRARLELLLTYLKATYWFVPALMTSCGVLLAIITTHFDRTLNGDVLQTVGGLFDGGPEDARQLFNTVAGAMITVAGVTFSLAILVLTLASQQFGPRLLYNFMRDTGTQIVLGTFVATFTYCLLVLRTVHVSETTSFVPHISAATAIALALISQVVLIYFFHHVAASIRVNNVIVNVSHELRHTIDWYCAYNQTAVSQGDQEAAYVKQFAAITNTPSHLVRSSRRGYVEVIDYPRLASIGRDYDIIMQVRVRIGEFVFDDGALVDVWPASAVSDEVVTHIRNGFVLGAERTSVQDIDFSINQLVEIAARAMSSTYNDSNTAVLCIDQLGLALAHVAKHDLPSSYRTDSEGDLRVVVPPVTLSSFIRTAFDQIRQFANGFLVVLRRLLEVIATLATQVREPQARAELRRQANLIHAAFTTTILLEEDRAELQICFEKAIAALDRPPATSKPG